jgi:hypothetical protein
LQKRKSFRESKICNRVSGYTYFLHAWLEDS